jgi:hypothetical protein
MQGSRRGAHDGEATALLAMRPLAALPVVELASPSAAELQALWRSPLLVTQPREHRL